MVTCYDALSLDSIIKTELHKLSEIGKERSQGCETNDTMSSPDMEFYIIFQPSSGSSVDGHGQPNSTNSRRQVCTVNSLIIRSFSRNSHI
jgi:hypothetical protein